MDSARQPARPVQSPVAPLQGASADGWPVVEQALLVLAADAGVSAALTERLLEVARGFSYRRISQLHGISRNTVKTQIYAVLDSLGASCCHEIRDAARAACTRAEAGATEDEIVRFVRLRFE